jgi:predicted choloylglycine hydrolase
VIKNVAVWDKQASFGLQKILVDAGCFCFVFLKDSECSEEVVADGITLVFYSNVDQLPSLYDKHKIDFVFSTYPSHASPTPTTDFSTVRTYMLW